VQYQYLKDQGQSYLREVRYNLFDGQYNSVLFNYEARDDARPDYRSRYKITTAWRCASIEIRSRGVLQRRYTLDYLSGAVSLLQRVTLTGRDGTTRLPPVTFTYTGATSNPMLTVMKNSPAINFNRTRNVELLDADGDGLPDILIGGAGNYRYYQNV